MSDDKNNTTPKLGPISVTVIEQFFNEKKAFNGCPCCSKQSWTLVEPPADYVWNYGSNMTSGGFVMPSPSVPAVLLACNNCGFIRTHAATLIQEYIDSKKVTP